MDVAPWWISTAGGWYRANTISLASLKFQYWRCNSVLFNLVLYRSITLQLSRTTPASIVSPGHCSCSNDEAQLHSFLLHNLVSSSFDTEFQPDLGTNMLY